MQSGPSIITLASSAFLDTHAMSTATTLTRVHASVFNLHEAGTASTLTWCHALAVIAILAMRHASAFVSRSILRDNRDSRFLCFESEVQVREDEPIVAFADLGRDARAIVAGRADGLASADFRVSITVETCAEIRRRACAVATFDVADWLASERDVSPVVVNHAITVFADAEIGRFADTVCFAGRMTDRVASVLRTRG